MESRSAVLRIPGHEEHAFSLAEAATVEEVHARMELAGTMRVRRGSSRGSGEPAGLAAPLGSPRDPSYPPPRMNASLDRWARIALVLSLVALAYALVVTAWQCDDAYITFRTVRNVFHGHGLTWNPGERVQAFTHPLWMFVALLAYGSTGEVFYSMSLVSMALTVATASGLAWTVRTRPWAAAVLVGILAGSRAFVDFGTSGLENPLLHVLLVVFARLAGGRETFRGDLARSMLLSAVLLTRIDAALLVLPAWVEAFVRRRPRGAVALGLAPFAAWELFSLVYYGSLVPNTAYAKLNLDIPRGALWAQGLAYLRDSVEHDPLTSVAMLVAIGFVAVRGDRTARALVLGVLAYLVYVVSIGGDFMSGRFLSAPLVLSLAAAALVVARGVDSDRVGVIAAAVVALYVLAHPSSPLSSGPTYGVGWSPDRVVRPSGVADERAYYYPTTGLLRVLLAADELRARGLPVPPYVGAIRGAELARAPERVAVYNEVGFFGYFVGDTQVVDVWALCDPLLARIPFRAGRGFRPGHYPRPIPEGYVESRASGENRIADPALRPAYDAIRLVTSGPLLSRERFAAIVALHTGKYAGAFAGVAAPARR